MKKFTVLIIFLLSLVLVACGSSIPTTTRPAIENNNNGQIRPTPTSDIRLAEPTDLPIPYPGAPPTAVHQPASYPAPQVIPTTNPYPEKGSTVWVLHPVGVQCEEDATGKYKSEQNVEAGLIAAGITVYDVTTTELMVCTACGCPTSIHYRAEIDEADLDKALSLGWEPE